MLNRSAYTALLLACSSACYALTPMTDQELAATTGQAGISLRLDVLAQIGRVEYRDTDANGGSVSLRNVKIDNGCVTVADCPNGQGGGIAYGAAKLGLSLPIFGVELPTLKVDVVNTGSGDSAVQLTLPDLTTINQQMIANGLPAQRIRMRVAGDMYVGESNLGNVEIRDITDIRGEIRIRGH
ncbi:DUF6160 family protein [Atopomonas sediminilitoris]|uniref:DUF6160 family protein n=1 Tax=Atopomonas sediminilitoris TaxID=2919919 RepID=UPI001F4E72BD|nr:DUF6160 family protein [Atopomonas sediminilitoris]MCJ8170417.1 hypothetical protein [Atopomonas sediminilitoris]